MLKVSVIIPTFNRSQYVCEAVKSVLAQTYKNFELIVVDDGSTDDTQERLEQYKNQIRYYRQKNQGVSTARDFGIRLARGEYVSVLDDDDLWMPEKLEKQVPVLDKNPDLAFVCSGSYVIDQNGSAIDQYNKGRNDKEDFETLRNSCFVMILTVLMRRKCYFSIGGFDRSIGFTEDYDLWLRMARRYKFTYLDKPLAKYRLHDNNCSKNLPEKLKIDIKIFQKDDVVGDLNYIQKRIILAKLFYKFGMQFYKQNDFTNAARSFLRACVKYPLIGSFYWPKEYKQYRFTLFTRLFNPYRLMIQCAKRSHGELKNA